MEKIFISSTSDIPATLAPLRNIQTQTAGIHVGMLFDKLVDHCEGVWFPATLKHLSPARNGKALKPSTLFSGRHSLLVSFTLGLLAGLLAGLVVYDARLDHYILYRTVRYFFSLF